MQADMQAGMPRDEVAPIAQDFAQEGVCPEQADALPSPRAANFERTSSDTSASGGALTAQRLVTPHTAVLLQQRSVRGGMP